MGSIYVVEDDGKVENILTGKDNSEIAEYDYNDDDESNYVEEDDGIIKDILIGKEGNEIVSEYDYKSEYVVVFDVPSEYQDDPEYKKFVEAAKLKDANKRSRMIVEFAMMSGHRVSEYPDRPPSVLASMGIIGLTIMFGLISLANS